MIPSELHHHLEYFCTMHKFESTDISMLISLANTNLSQTYRYQHLFLLIRKNINILKICVSYFG